MSNENQNYSDEYTLLQLFQKLNRIVRFIFSKWIKILVYCFFGAIIGFGYAIFVPVKYTSRLTFVVEDVKAGAGGLASLAGQFGFDIGGSSGGGVFSGENIILFLTSEGLIRETLMSYYDEKQKITLADQYAFSSKLKSKWGKNMQIGDINFAIYKKGNFPRKEDSLMQLIVSKIKSSELVVGKPDKKASFIEVKVTTTDELLSKLFTDRLVQIAAARYIETKTRTKAINVEKLQKKADSLSLVLNSKTYTAASNQQTLVDANPAIRTAPIVSEISSREKALAVTIFSEVVKNLEISKTMLSQETPFIQIVDQSTFPLQKNKPNKIKSLLIGGILSGVLYILYILFKKIFSSK